MIIWVDAQFSPQIATWMRVIFSIEVMPLRDIGLRDAEDRDIFNAARSAGAVVMTKDRDFVEMVKRQGAPPQVLWVTCGNTSNARLREILTAAFPDAQQLLASGEPLVEICDS